MILINIYATTTHQDHLVETRPLTALKSRLLTLLDDVLDHDGYGSIRIDVRLLKKGQKEVILDCGKQYRYVVDHLAVAPSNGAVRPGSGQEAPRFS